jgi:hypothetical protein
VRLADVQPVDHVAAVDESGACHDDVVRAAGPGEAADRLGHDRGHVGSQEPAVVDVARVPGLPCRGAGRVAEHLVVRADRDDRTRPVDEHRSTPRLLEGVADRARRDLHGVRP